MFVLETTIALLITVKVRIIDQPLWASTILRLPEAVGRRLHSIYTKRVYVGASGDKMNSMKKILSRCSGLLLALSVWSPVFAEEAAPELKFKIVFPKAQKDPEAFIRNHRVIFGRSLYLEKETESSQVGMLMYPVFNDKPERLYGLPIEILKGPGLESGDRETLQSPSGYSVLLVEHEEQKGKYVVLGHLASQKKDAEGTLLSIQYEKIPFENPKLRYERVLEEAVADLSSPDSEKRSSAISLLTELGKEALPHVPLIAKGLSDPDEGVVRNAATALRLLRGPDAEAAIPQMIGALKSGNVQYTVIETLGTFGSKSKAAVPAIIRALEETEATVFVGQCVTALSLIAPGDQQVVKALAPYLEDPTVETRKNARIASGLEEEK